MERDGEIQNTEGKGGVNITSYKIIKKNRAERERKGWRTAKFITGAGRDIGSQNNCLPLLLMGYLWLAQMNDTATYAKPHAPAAQMASSQLDSMLGSLQSDMSKQGVSTTAKGHCAACNKPIVGQKWFPWFKSGNLIWTTKKDPECHKKFEDEELKAKLNEDPTQTQMELAKTLGVTEPLILHYLKEMGMIQKVRNWVAYELKPRGFLHRIVTDDEKWVYSDNPKRQATYVYPGRASSSMAKPNIHGGKIMLCIWWDQLGVQLKLLSSQVVTAMGKTWHSEHFTCHHCNTELSTKTFFERDGKPYCETDYHNIFSPRCAYCNGPILDKCVTALDKTWHPEHFFCTQCGRQFGEEGFHERDGQPYCRTDFLEMFAPKCGGCNRPITENYISALNSQWHPDCFVCRDCLQPFNGGSFYDHEGQPYCETHYHAKRGSLCAGCHKPITGRCVTAMFRKFHPEHFVCSFCLKQLNKGTFKEQNDKPYCHACFDKLYG
ncbi:TGFB1I1 [Cordylochernes scorpioides]|uniref:TGFB1I1 n=1 Tax=Cordylochernes scorpioides TaxID=51811 RepID=A0ABY6KL36_9ARAC|nr:TGFB1I1 [Cordylochernes scorpioides]